MYEVMIKKKAKKDILTIPKKDQIRILAALNVLSENPFVGKKLEGRYKGAWSMRIWPYRIIYTIHKDIVTIVVLRIGHRQGVYV